MQRQDVVVIGAGPVGCTAALAFAAKGADVLVLEANPKGAQRLAGEWLHPPALDVLEDLGVDPHVEGSYAFVHAGLSRGALNLSDIDYALAHERPTELLWQRSTAEIPHSLGVTVVYGHTPMPDLQIRWNLPYSIGIDTGCVYGGSLTALRLPDETIFQV